jgi:hypothetical protein
VTLKESAHSRCWLFKNYILINCTTTYKKYAPHYKNNLDIQASKDYYS